ncbi:hypothetical protein OKW31_002735 [Paraburkholderia atlantica]|uniref:hypothetical protein n=1 Tax=Paraburkholderia atlantica TaxID=2654982 RepID=UPI003D1C9046
MARIDSLGFDESDCPVIIEYKRHSNENVINQGLFYLDWLLAHRVELRCLVMKMLDKDAADEIEWTGTRLLCIGADFTRYGEHAVQQIPRNIELIRYKFFGDDLLLFELLNAQSVPDAIAVRPALAGSEAEPANPDATGKLPLDEQLASVSPQIRDLYGLTTGYLHVLGDDAQEKRLSSGPHFGD